MYKYIWWYFWICRIPRTFTAHYWQMSIIPIRGKFRSQILRINNHPICTSSLYFWLKCVRRTRANVCGRDRKRFFSLPLAPTLPHKSCYNSRAFAWRTFILTKTRDCSQTNPKDLYYIIIGSSYPFRASQNKIAWRGGGLKYKRAKIYSDTTHLTWNNPGIFVLVSRALFVG